MAGVLVSFKPAFMCCFPAKFMVRLASGRTIEVPADQVSTRQDAKEAQMKAAATAVTTALSGQDPLALEDALAQVSTV